VTVGDNIYGTVLYQKCLMVGHS